MTDKEKLKIYDQLREAHRYITVLDIDAMDDEFAKCAIVAVDNVLYLAERYFARMEP